MIMITSTISKNYTTQRLKHFDLDDLSKKYLLYFLVEVSLLPHSPDRKRSAHKDKHEETDLDYD